MVKPRYRVTIADSFVSGSQVTKTASGGHSPKKKANIPHFNPTKVEEGKEYADYRDSTPAQASNKTAGHTQPLICAILDCRKRRGANIRPPRTSL